MTNKWEPENLDSDPMVNAVLNVAGELNNCAQNIGALLYAFKYSREEGKSVAEAIEVAATASAEIIATSISDGFNELACSMPPVEMPREDNT